MKYIRTTFLLFSLSLFSSAHGSETLLNYVKVTSQAMSSFYMQSLSEGNEKYLNDFNKFKYQSSLLLDQYARDGGPRSEEFLKRWKGISDRLVLVYDKEYGWEVDENVRQDFRSYLSDLYQLVDIQKSSYTSLSQRQLLSVVQMEAIAARFFDVSSLFNVKVSIFSSDKNKLNPKEISQTFKRNLDVLAEMSKSEATKRKLASVKSKWEFVESSVIDYEGNGAYFLVYATKNRIQKELLVL